jgi:ferredoxin-NADP reductase
MAHDDEDPRAILRDAREYNATLVGRVDHTPDMTTFRVKLDDGPIAFRAGQYLTLGIAASGRLWQRPYSVASPPSVAGTEGYELLVRLVPVVRFTSLLWRLQPGARLQVLGPDGTFTLEPGDRRTHLYVASGTAIAPFLSMIWETLHQRRPIRTVLVHGVSHVADLAYRQVLEAMEVSGTYPLRYIPTVSRPLDPQNAGWRGRTGRAEAVVGAVCDQLDLRRDATTAYLCGNPDMIEHVQAILRDRHFPEHLVRRELYWPAGPARPEWMRRGGVKDMTGSG